MSGLGAPLRTATPAPEFASMARVAATSLPCRTRSSTAAAVSTARSNVAPLSIAAFNGTAAPQVKVSLCSVAFSKAGASCSSVLLSPLELITLTSAAPAGTWAASNNANPTAAAVSFVSFIAIPPVLQARPRILSAVRCRGDPSAPRSPEAGNRGLREDEGRSGNLLPRRPFVRAGRQERGVIAAATTCTTPYQPPITYQYCASDGVRSNTARPPSLASLACGGG